MAVRGGPGRSRPQEVGEGHLACGGGSSPAWLTESTTLPGSMARTCPQERKQPSQLAGQGAAGSCREPRGGRPSLPMSCLLRKALLGRKGCEDWSWGWGRNLLWFSLLHLPDVLSSCLSPSLPCWPQNGKVTFPEKGRDTPKKERLPDPQTSPGSSGWVLTKGCRRPPTMGVLRQRE